MSRHEDSFQIPLPPEQAKPLCAQAITSLGLPATDLGHGFACAESFQIGFTWPATMQVLINYGDTGITALRYCYRASGLDAQARPSAPLPASINLSTFQIDILMTATL